MFNIQEIKLGVFKAIRLVNTNTEEYIEILTEFGAGINDLVVKNKDGHMVSMIDGYRSEEEIIHDHHTAFKGCKLSPFPNRIPEGKYKYGGKTFQLAINDIPANNNLHGLLHNRPFEIVNQESCESSASIELRYVYKGVDLGFPFQYTLNLTYRLDKTGVSFLTQIENTGSATMPMGDGWHPYFLFENLDEIDLEMGTAIRLSSNVGNPLTELHGFESCDSLAKKQLDDCFEVQQDDKYQIILKDQKQGIEVGIELESETDKYKYFQIYTPPSRRSIAIEPVTCPPNAFNTGIGLIELEPKQVLSMSFDIKYKLLNN
ncbi:aldose 1-epimerase [Reichenbachiella sp.]|uniref:aldose 1-epimerase n=1 Tax=Reichenbachiella sp. TaxID=2184521 RepID=UPI003B5A045A